MSEKTLSQKIAWWKNEKHRLNLAKKFKKMSKDNQTLDGFKPELCETCGKTKEEHVGFHG